MKQTTEFLWQRQDDFRKDRPLLGEHNASIKNLLKLLTDEIYELNGHSEDGMSIEQYRIQEIADIGWFIISLAHMLDIHLRDEQVENMSNAFPTRDVNETWTNKDESEYERIKSLLEAMAVALEHNQHIQADDAEAVLLHGQEEVTAMLTLMMAFAMALCRLVGQELPEAMMEKQARNHLKHAPVYYSRSNYSSYDEGKIAASKAWKELDGNRNFYAYTDHLR